MENRYEDVTTDVTDVLRNVMQRWFPELAGCNIKVVFDLKKKMTDGKLVLGRIKKTNDLEKHLSIEEAGTDDGYDYIMILDKKAWELASDEDKVRLVRHELRHTSVDTDSDKPWKLRGHTVNDFYSEIELNQDNPKWGQDLVIRTMSSYQNDDDSQVE